MILKRKKISRKYNISLVRIKAISGWCSYCDYFNDSDDEGRNNCIFTKTNNIRIYDICVNIVPEKMEKKLENYAYVIIKKKRG